MTQISYSCFDKKIDAEPNKLAEFHLKMTVISVFALENWPCMLYEKWHSSRELTGSMKMTA